MMAGFLLATVEAHTSAKPGCKPPWDWAADKAARQYQRGLQSMIEAQRITPNVKCGRER